MTDPIVTAPAGDPGHDRRTLALVVLCAGMSMIILDQTITNVALPSIRRDLGFSPSGLAWVVNAYLVAFGGLLLLAGRLGDLVGRTRCSRPDWRCSPPRRWRAGWPRRPACSSPPASSRGPAGR